MRKILIVGILAFAMIASAGLVSATEVNIDFDVGAGNVIVTADNTEAYSGFHGIGGWTGNFNTVETGNYLDTNCLVESTTGANFWFDGYQELSGYTNNKVTFSSFAGGDTAVLNNRFDNSNYVVQLERVDTSKDFLSASGIGYGIGWRNAIEDKTTSIESAYVQTSLIGNGNGALDTNQWHSTSIGSYGWGNPDGISAPSLPGYYTPTNTASATGCGAYTFTGYGANSFTMNFNFYAPNGGSYSGGILNFNDGFTGTYSGQAR